MAQDVKDRPFQSPAGGGSGATLLTTVNTLSNAAPTVPYDFRQSERPRSGTATSAAGCCSPSRRSAMSVERSTRSASTPQAIRTLPGWVRSVECSGDGCDGTSRLLLSSPNDIFVAQHNTLPGFTWRAVLDRTKVDTGDQVNSSTGRRESRWKKFARSVAYPRISQFEETTVEPEWLNVNIGDYLKPCNGSKDEVTTEPGSQQAAMSDRRDNSVQRIQSTLLKSPIVPLIFRLTVWFFSLTALALGGSIRYLSDAYNSSQGPSADMAIVVDAVALVYLVYITWDEYTGKPLGLRSPNAKMRLIFLDIFFIVFDSANLSLAFASLSDIRGSCASAGVDELGTNNNAICERQRALASVLLIALIAWLSTFGISVFRLVERVAR